MQSADFPRVHLPEVGDRGLVVQFGHDLVLAIPLVLLVAQSQLRDLAVRVHEVPKRDGLRRTGLLTRRHQLAVLNIAAQFLRLILGVRDAPDAEVALFHHTHIAGGDRGVELLIERRGELVVEPVEAPHLVRAVVRAVARAHATIVDHRVETFRIVVGRINRADHLATGVATLLTEHRHHPGFKVVPVALDVTLHAQPRHFAANRRALFAHDRKVVLRVAGDHAGRTPVAAVEVNRHAPAIGLVVTRGFRTIRIELDDLLGAMVPAAVFSAVLQFIHRGSPSNVAAKLTGVAVHVDRVGAFSGSRNFRTGADEGDASGVVQRGRKQIEDVDAVAVCGFSGVSVSLSQWNGDGVAVNAKVIVGGGPDFPLRGFDRHHLTIRDAELLGRVWIDLHPRIPDDLADGVGGLLQPRLVGAAAISQEQ